VAGLDGGVSRGCNNMHGSTYYYLQLDIIFPNNRKITRDSSAYIRMQQIGIALLMYYILQKHLGNTSINSSHRFKYLPLKKGKFLWT
jgi:hypothetical protein